MENQEKIEKYKELIELAKRVHKAVSSIISDIEFQLFEKRIKYAQSNHFFWKRFYLYETETLEKNLSKIQKDADILYTDIQTMEARLRYFMGCKMGLCC